MIKKIESKTNNEYKIFSFNKLYLIERIGFPIPLNYERILKEA